MKKMKSISIMAVLLSLGLFLGRYVLPVTTDRDHESAVPILTEAHTIWTCSMHPQIQQTEPGSCPICGMDLIPLESDADSDTGPRTLKMSKSAIALAEIQTTEVMRAYPEATVRLVGKLDYDETKVKSITARFPARIDQLFVNYTGITVKKGDHLADVYSPELLSAQREFLSSVHSNPGSSISKAAREKLRLWDLLPDQIDAILENGEPSDHFILKAPMGGVVITKNVKEGDYIKTGESLFRIVDLSSLWLNMDAYESELTWLRYGQEVNFSVEAFPGKSFSGKIVFIEPEVNRKTRTVTIRVNVDNQERDLKPGMFAKGEVQMLMAQAGQVYIPEFAGKWISPMHPEIVKDGPGECDVCGMDLVPAETLGYVNEHPESAPLVIPSSAVLRTGKRAVVYVESVHTEHPQFEGREIVLGPKAGDMYVVVSGLQEGERVVTHGAFKIDSSLQIQAKPSMMNPQSESLHSTTDPHAGSNLMPQINIEDLEKLLPFYLKMQTALSQDELPKAKAQAKAMMELTGHRGALSELLHHMTAAENIDSFRKPYFDHLSQAFIAAIADSPAQEIQPLYRMNCPMVYGNTGADWLQATDELRNPYFGSAMLSCGEITETFGK
ncbi:efflux RND transporter periplasmic adaptor subunit [Kiritimatiellota bacterium B12222]|nr:efflux RND transporter periplasmic adaptor subunit [Kiritimatiellota bacterium B12222]